MSAPRAIKREAINPIFVALTKSFLAISRAISNCDARVAFVGRPKIVSIYLFTRPSSGNVFVERASSWSSTNCIVVRNTSCESITSELIFQ